MTISFYPSTFSKTFEVVSPETVMWNIQSGTWKEIIDYLRILNKAEYDAEKKNRLPAVTWSGVFNPGTRSKETIKYYSHLVVIDVDHLDESAVPVLKEQLRGDEYVRYCFVSPSNKGIKIVVQVNTGSSEHRSAFLHLQDYFQKKYLIKVDPSGKDECRLCYISFDPTPVINAGSRVFEVDLKYGVIISEYRTTKESFKNISEAEKIYPVAIKWIEKKFTYVEGQRNVYLHALSCALNRCGVRQEDCINLIYRNYPVPDDKWIQSVKSAYFHNQSEHGTYRIRDLGTEEFVAPSYVENFTDDVAANDLMMITSTLYTYKVPNNEIINIIQKVSQFYDIRGYIDLRRTNLFELMNESVRKLQEKIVASSAEKALKYETAEDMGVGLIDMDLSGGLKLYVEPIDMVTGGIFVGNYYGLIGFGGTYKSVLAQYISYRSAMDDIPVLYLNGEMSKMQWYERLAKMVFNVNLKQELLSGKLNKSNINDFIASMQQATKKNIFVYSGLGFSKTEILSTIDHIYGTTGKKIKLVFMDGLSQMDQGGREEAPANIQNSLVCKEIAKAANGGEGVALISLIHCSGAENKLIRDTGKVVRGGSKLISNMDGYISTSLFIDPQLVNEDNANDINFIEGKFCLRYCDKRSGSGVNYSVCNITDNLMVQYEDRDYRTYEFKQ